jgi:hypothetical protein
MSFRRSSPIVPLLLLTATLYAASAGAVPLPDVELEDVNSTSPHYGDFLSPRDYLGSVTAWYFGHAT